MTIHAPIDSTKIDRIKDAIAVEPGGILEALAEEHAVALRVVMDCLPKGSVAVADGSRFVEILEDVTQWGNITFICHSKDAVIEISGPLPIGRMGHGMYNLQGGETGLGGHLRPDRCAAIYFVRRPFMGKNTMSIQFFNSDGAAMFKVYVGRDRERRLLTGQVERFSELEARCCAEGVH